MNNEFKEDGILVLGQKVQDKLPDSIEQSLRTFAFRNEDGEKFEMSIKHIGSLSEVYANLINGKTENGRIDPPKSLNRIVDAFRSHALSITNNKGEAAAKKPHLLISGGFVRDVLSGAKPNDIDLATDMSSEQTYNLLKDLPEIRKIGIHGQSNEIVRVKFTDGEEYEISSFRKGEGADISANSPGQDAQAREFTVNSLFYDPLSGNAIDYVGGMEDIRDKKLKFTRNAEKRIREDGVRMLRYIRFLFKTGFSPIEQDMEAVRRMAPYIKQEAGERIKGELDKILGIAGADKALGLLDSLGLLEQVFPEIKAMQDCGQGPPYHLEGDAYRHTMLVAGNLPEDASLRLKWAAIFHDIAKPETRDEKEKDGKKKVSFIGHDKLGAAKAASILKRAYFSNKEIDEITWLIANHMALYQQVAGRINSAEGADRERARCKARAVLVKMIMDKGSGLVKDLIELAGADERGSIPEAGVARKDHKIIEEVFSEAIAESEKDKEAGMDFEKIVSGKLIMGELGIKPGPEIGLIRKAVLEQLLESGQTFDTEADAKKYIRGLLRKIDPGAT